MNREERRLIRDAKEDYYYLTRYIEKYKGTFEELKKQLNGHSSISNIDFETEWSGINALVQLNQKTNEIKVSTIVKIWDGQNEEYIKINGSKEIDLKDYKSL